MPSLKSIKKRITSVKNTQKITRAMKLVSAAKLRRATDRAQSSRPFEAELKGMVSCILQDAEWSSDLVTQRPIQKVGLVVISTDRGLCGSLNTNNFKNVLKRIQALNGSASVEILAVGKKAYDFFRKRGFTIRSHHADVMRKSSYEFLGQLSKGIREDYLSGKLDRVEIFYSRFQSALIQIPSRLEFLPFVPPSDGERKSFIYEPAAPALLESLVPMLIDFQFYRVVLESIASEHGARMSAMESATKNARDMIDRLTLARNRARQAAITKELMEIIGGAEALSA